MEQIEISVIMACYNEKLNWIHESIKSVLDQSFKNFEFIIVCDNPDNIELINVLREYEKRDTRIVLIINEKNSGIVKSANNGLSVARGKYIARMDADDINFLDRFEKQYKYLEKNLDVDFIGGIGIMIDEEGKELYQINKLGRSYEKTKKSLLYRNIFFQPSWMFRRTILDKVGFYNEIPCAEDLDFVCRVIINKYNVINLPENVIKVRTRTNGISNSNRLKQIKVARIIMKNYKSAIRYNREYKPLEEINKLQVDKNENYKYTKACELYFEGINFLRNKNVLKGFSSIIKSFFASKEKRVDLYSTIMIKIINI